MRIYVETNFVLEMAFEQEQVAACEDIVQFAETNKNVSLVIPAFCFIEPPERLRRQAHARLELQNTLAREQRELKRSKRFTQEQENAWAAVDGILVSDTQEAERRFESLRDRLIRVAHVLPLNANVIADGAKYLKQYGLKFPDALVLASVLADPELGRGPSCFLNRNTKDFDDPAITGALVNRGCRLIGRFDAGLGYIRSELTPRPPSP